MNTPVRVLCSVFLALIAALAITGCADTPETMLTTAKEHLAKNDRNAAVIMLRNVLQKKPDLAEARFLLGRSLVESNDLAGAEKELRRAEELGYPADSVAPLLAQVYLTRREFKKVIEEFSYALTGSGTKVGDAARVDLISSLGHAYLGLGDVRAAKEAFSVALSARPDYPRALMGEAWIVMSTGDVAAGLALLESTLAKAPRLTEGWQLKADLLLSQQKVDEAIAAYRKAYETKPDHLAARHMVVSLLVQQGNTQEARKEIEAMKAVAPKHPWTFYLQALLDYHEKNYAAAREAIQLSHQGDPTNLLGMLLGAQIDFQLGSYAQAETALAAVLQRAPKHLFARRLLVRTYVKQGRSAKAVEALQPLLQDADPDSEVLALAGEVYTQNGDTVTAARYFDRAAALDPKSSRKRTNAALARLAKGDNDRGLAELESIAADDKGIRADLALVASNVERRNFDAALVAVDAIQRKQPKAALPHALRGTILLSKGDTALARKSFERALEMDPLYFPAVQSLARLDVMDKKPDEAKKRFDAVLAKDPKNVQAMLALASLYAQAGGLPDDVAKMISNAIKINPGDSTPRLALISYYLQEKDPKKAILTAQDALSALPDRPEILNAAAAAYRSAGDYNQSISTYNKLVQLRPESIFPLMRIAELQVANNDTSAAIATLNKVLEVKPDAIEARQALVALNAVSGRTGEALKAAREVQKARPKESMGYMLEGNVLSFNKSFADAAAAYRAGLKHSPTTDLAQGVYASLVSAGKASEAESFLASWLKEHPTDSVFRHRVAHIAILRRDYATAAREYKAIVDSDEKDALTLNNLAWVAGQLNDPKAIEYAERADKLAPGHPVILDTYGVLLVDKGETARGIELLQRAVSLSPDSGEIRLNLARALIKSGQKQAAKKELETLAAMGTKFPMQAEVAKMMQGL